MKTHVAFWIGLALGAMLLGCAEKPSLLKPDSKAMNQAAPAVYKVQLETTKGNIVIEVHRDWAPHGADRFYNLVRAGYFDRSKFYRIDRGQWVQFGINGDPAISTLWRNKTFPDDPVTSPQHSNVRGTVAFAFAVPNGRTTQLFINMRDNSATHDREPFIPIGQVTQGMDIADALYAGYGENSGGGIRGGKQDPLFQQGNAYLEKNFPNLDAIIRASILPDQAQSDAPV